MVSNRPSVTLFWPPANALVDGVSVELFVMLDVRVGAQEARVWAMAMSWICGLNRST